MELAFQPQMVFLADEDKDRLHQGILEVLGEVGMVVMHEEARETLLRAGCRQGEKSRILVPEALVTAALASAPQNIEVFDRDGKPVMDLGGRRPFFGTGSDLTWHLDEDTGERRLSTLSDVVNAARLADALPNLDFIMSFGHPHDVEPQAAYLESFRAMAENSVKPIVCTARDRRDLEAMWEISSLLRGGPEELRAKPYLIHYAEPTSPFKHPLEMVDKLIFCAEKGAPLIYSPAPIAGSTAPITIAGHVIQGLSECLCGLVLHQLTAEGAPFLMGMGPAVLDMATGQCSYNAPEYLMSYVAAVEMSHYYNLPNWGYAGTTDAQIPDGQAVFEAGLVTFLAAAIGSNLNHDVGYTDFGQTGCLEMIVVMNEVIDQVRRFMRGAPMDAGHLALSVIRDAAADGDFMSHDHTHEHFRSVQWRPKLLCRQSHKAWDTEGRTSLSDRAKARLADILENHRPAPLGEETAAAINDVVRRYSQES